MSREFLTTRLAQTGLEMAEEGGATLDLTLKPYEEETEKERMEHLQYATKEVLKGNLDNSAKPTPHRIALARWCQHAAFS